MGKEGVKNAPSHLQIVAVGILRLPAPRVLAHGAQRLIGHPSQQILRTGSIRVAGRDVAGTSVHQLGRDRLARHLLEHPDDLEHGVAIAGPKVDRDGTFQVSDFAQRGDVAVCEVTDMQEIADAAAVGRVVIRAKNFEFGAAADSELGHTRKKVVGRVIWRLANFS